MRGFASKETTKSAKKPAGKRRAEMLQSFNFGENADGRTLNARSRSVRLRMKGFLAFLAMVAIVNRTRYSAVPDARFCGLHNG